MSAAQRLAKALNKLEDEIGVFEPCSCCNGEMWGTDDDGNPFGVRPITGHGWVAVE